ncbi:hypothetical protein J6590_042027 [Homalodisca vitripennis]|nr:hypothetical protein J6590_042027 [Homalodisca vitripennis]
MMRLRSEGAVTEVGKEWCGEGGRKADIFTSNTYGSEIAVRHRDSLLALILFIIVLGTSTMPYRRICAISSDDKFARSSGHQGSITRIEPSPPPDRTGRPRDTKYQLIPSHPSDLEPPQLFLSACGLPLSVSSAASHLKTVGTSQLGESKAIDFDRDGHVSLAEQRLTVTATSDAVIIVTVLPVAGN